MTKLTINSRGGGAGFNLTLKNPKGVQGVVYVTPKRGV